MEIYDIEILDPEEEEDLCPDCGWPIDVCICDKEEIYVWSDDGECDACSEMAGTILDDDHVPSLHPNCNCQAVKMTPEEYRDEFGEPNPVRQEKYQQLKAEEKAREVKEMDKVKGADKPEKQDPKEMKLSEEGLDRLKSYESAVKVDGKHVIYDDKTGLPVPEGQALPKGATIGYGHLVKPGEDFSKGLTEKEATELFQKDISFMESAVRNNIDAPLAQHQFDALLLLTYNIGPAGLRDSTIGQYINNPDFSSSKYPTPESAWKAFNKDNGVVVRGLVNRRNMEWGLFSN